MIFTCPWWSYPLYTLQLVNGPIYDIWSTNYIKFVCIISLSRMASLICFQFLFPERAWNLLTVERSMHFISSAESSSLTEPPIQSTISTLKTSPVMASATGGIWGCQRLWRGGFCCHGLLFKSIGTTTFGVGGAIESVNKQGSLITLAFCLIY